MSDPSTTVEVEGFGSKMCKALGGVYVGICLFFGCMALLAWNEFNYVDNADLFLYVKANVHEIDNCAIDKGYVDKGIAAQCSMKVLPDFAADPTVATFPGFVEDLRRAWVSAESEIYQWVETKSCSERKVRGSTVKTCNYYHQKDWNKEWVDTNKFHCTHPCRSTSGELVDNPSTWTMPSALTKTYNAVDYAVKLGGEQGTADTYFSANSDMVKKLTEGVALHLEPTPSHVQTVVAGAQVSGSGDYIYFLRNNGQGTGGQTAEIGNIRTKFSASAATVNSSVSFIALEHTESGELAPWDTHKSGTMNPVNVMYEGSLSVSDMIDRMSDENSATTWAFRVAGFFGMFAGLMLITAPIAIAPEILPCGELISDLVGCALCCMNLLLSASCAFIVAGCAWAAARPLIGIPMLLGACCCLCGAVGLQQKMKGSRTRVQLEGPGQVMIANQYPQPGGTAMVAAPVATQTMAVACPAGCGPGSQVQVQAPDGRQVVVQVPPGVSAGMQFQVQV